jgi:uncharacterized glyoxalase superfamily protein PhnB
MPVKQIPEGYHTVTPYLIVSNVQQVTDFLVHALDAQVKERVTTPDGHTMHSEVTIGDSIVMMGQANPQHPPKAASLYVYVPDVDAAFARAVKAGAQVIMEPKDQLYGDRSGGIKDPSGNEWWLGTHIEDVPGEEIARRYAAQREA